MTKTASEVAHLFRALKAPAASRALPALADRAREEAWSYERFAEAPLSTEVSARDSHGGQSRIKAARFPARKTLEECARLAARARVGEFPKSSLRCIASATRSQAEPSWLAKALTRSRSSLVIAMPT
jgi:DNA replication protein DnaC